MYQTTIQGQGLYRACSQGYGEPVKTFGTIADGETPMSLLNIALASCVIICVQGYFKRHHDVENLEVNVSSSYEAEVFTLAIDLGQALDKATQEAVKAYITKHCRVKQLLRPEIRVEVAIVDGN